MGRRQTAVSDLTQLAEVAPRLVFVEDNGDGTTMWRDGHGAHAAIYRLDHRHVIQYSLNDKMREGLARLEREGISEPQEGPPEATEPSTEVLGRTPGVEAVGGSSDGWQWAKAERVESCPLDTDGDGDCAACGNRRDGPRVRRDLGCQNGVICTVVWALDNKPMIDAWRAEGDPTKPCPELYKAIVPHHVILAIAQM